MTDFPTIQVGLDPKVERTAPPTEVHHLQWAYLDTALNVLREGAARAVLLAVREAAARDGQPFPSDAEIMAKAAEDRAAGDEDTPEALKDFVYVPDAVLRGLSLIFQNLMDGTVEMMEESFAGYSRFVSEVDDLTGGTLHEGDGHGDTSHTS